MEKESKIEVVKDKSNKKIKVVCKFCRSVLKIPMKEFKSGIGDTRFYTCPVCNTESCIYDKIFGWF